MVIWENDDAIHDGIRTFPEDPVKELISMIHITCEGRSFDFFDGATPQNLWNMVRGTRGKEQAVLAEMDGELLDFQTPFPSGGDVRWIPLSAPKAHQAYVRSAIMLLVCAVEEIYGEGADVLVKHSLGKSLYCEFEDGHVPLKKELERLAERMREISEEGRDITKLVVGKKRAMAFLRIKGREEDAELTGQLAGNTINVDQCGRVIDYFFGPLLPDMSFVRLFALKSYAPGFLLRLPDEDFHLAQDEAEDPLFAKVFLESQNWSELIGCQNLAQLNASIENGKILDYISIAEALHEKKLAELADAICEAKPRIRLVCMAGPSSSGKTTFMRRLIVHLQVNGVRPVMISLDDYFRDRSEMQGEDWEDIHALDLDRFEGDITALLEGKPVQLPTFNFITGKKEWNAPPVTLGKGQPILVEGLHALNPRLTYFVPGYQCMHIYLSALTQITINHHNRISTSDTRLLRRMVRDMQFRGNPPEKTISSWPGVRKGEERNIFHFQGRADVVFNSALLYEIPVLKRIVKPFLEEISKDSPAYGEALRLLEFLAPFRELDASLVPDHSLLREFVGYQGLGRSFLNR